MRFAPACFRGDEMTPFVLMLIFPDRKQVQPIDADTPEKARELAMGILSHHPETTGYQLWHGGKIIYQHHLARPDGPPGSRRP